jgi:hypothetical protein
MHSLIYFNFNVTFVFRRDNIKKVFHSIGKAVRQVKTKAEEGNFFYFFINLKTYKIFEC